MTALIAIFAIATLLVVAPLGVVAFLLLRSASDRRVVSAGAARPPVRQTVLPPAAPRPSVRSRSANVRVHDPAVAQVALADWVTQPVAPVPSAPAPVLPPASPASTAPSAVVASVAPALAPYPAASPAVAVVHAPPPSPGAPGQAEFALVAPVELGFGESSDRIGVRRGSQSEEAYRAAAEDLLGHLRATHGGADGA